MTHDDFLKIAEQAGFSVENGHVIAKSEMGPAHALCTNAIIHFASRIQDAVYKEAYEIALYAPFKKSADLIMKEIEQENPDVADDFFNSAEFRYAMNNTVKATAFTICCAIRDRGKNG